VVVATTVVVAPPAVAGGRPAVPRFPSPARCCSSAPASPARHCCAAAAATSSSKASKPGRAPRAAATCCARRAPLAACARIASTADVVAEPAAENGEIRGPVLTSRTPAWADGMALADYLARRFPYLDASAWCREIEDGRVAVNARIGALDSTVRRG